MKIVAKTEDGSKTRVFNAKGDPVDLPIAEYDTETQVVKHYVLEDDGRVKMGEWDHSDDGKGKRKPLMVETHLPGSYAEIDGKKV